MGGSVSQEQISDMFNRISSQYDRANQILSLGIDRKWRRAVVDYLPGQHLNLLDCATGTCDQLLSMMRSGKIDRAIGIDLAEEMLRIGQQKVNLSPFRERIHLILGNVLDIPLESNQFDCITMTFGIRNVQGNCLPEMLRLLKPGGSALILEFSLPENRLVRAFHMAYLRRNVNYT